MTRRAAMKAVAASVLVLNLAGCSPDTVAAFVKTIGTLAAQLATYFGAADVAAQLVAAAATVATDIAEWQSGSAAADAVQAINDMIDLVDAIPVRGPYTVFLDLLLGALSGLLALLPASAYAAWALAHQSGAPRRAMVPTPYGGFDRGSMRAADVGLLAGWGRLQATVGPTVR